MHAVALTNKDCRILLVRTRMHECMTHTSASGWWDAHHEWSEQSRQCGGIPNVMTKTEPERLQEAVAHSASKRSRKHWVRDKTRQDTSTPKPQRGRRPRSLSECELVGRGGVGETARYGCRICVGRIRLLRKSCSRHPAPAIYHVLPQPLGELVLAHKEGLD